MHSNFTGITGENKIKNWLIAKGHRILDQNYECQPFGEIDLVSLKDNSIYFVEVKTRNSDKYMNLTDTVDNRKLKAMGRSANLYISKQNIPQDKYQFIIALVTYNIEKDEINMYEDLYLIDQA